jgi:hypothetical protein
VNYGATGLRQGRICTVFKGILCQFYSSQIIGDEYRTWETSLMAKSVSLVIAVRCQSTAVRGQSLNVFKGFAGGVGDMKEGENFR